MRKSRLWHLSRELAELTGQGVELPERTEPAMGSEWPTQWM